MSKYADWWAVLHKIYFKLLNLKVAFKKKLRKEEFQLKSGQDNHRRSLTGSKPPE